MHLFLINVRTAKYSIIISASLSISIASGALMLRTCRLAQLLRHVRIAESEPYCHSILSVCLSVGHSATYSLPNLVGRYIPVIGPV